MKAMILPAFGGPEIFEEQDISKPAPGPSELLVKVYATSVNPADCGVRQGLFGPRIQLPAILGYDVSGVVEAVGEAVQRFQSGDEVFYAIDLLAGSGANAEYHVANEARVVRKPTNCSHEAAAAVPVAGGTAWAALVEHARIKIGETVLIHGGAGGVGSFAVQIAKAAGAFVYTTCGGYDIDRVQALGADRVIDYRQEDFREIIAAETQGEGVDVVFTTVSGPVLTESLQIIKPYGRAVTVTGVAGDLNAAISRNVAVYFVHLDDPRPKLEALRTLIERDQLQPLISMALPLNQVGSAHQQLEQGGEGVYGKIVLQVA